MLLLNRTEFHSLLREKSAKVNFTKVNGQKRDIVCTLDSSKIGDSSSESSRDSLPETSGQLRVWDLEENAWRSFLIENVNWIMVLDD